MMALVVILEWIKTILATGMTWFILYLACAYLWGNNIWIIPTWLLSLVIGIVITLWHKKYDDDRSGG